MRYIAIVVLVVALSFPFVSCDRSSQTDEIAAKAATLLAEQQKKEAEEKAKLEQQIQAEVEKQMAEKEAEEKAEAEAKAKEKAAAGTAAKPATTSRQRYFDRCMKSHTAKDHAYCDCFSGHAAQNVKAGASKQDERKGVALAALACVGRK